MLKVSITQTEDNFDFRVLHVMRPIPYDESVTSHGGAHAIRGAIVNDHLLQSDLGPKLI